MAARDGLDSASLRRGVLTAGITETQQQPVTPTAEKIKELLSYGVFDWAVSESDERQIVDLLKNDPNLPATVAELNGSGWLGALFNRVDEPSTRRELVRLFGASPDAGVRSLAEPHVNSLGREWQVQYNLARLGVPGAGTRPPRGVTRTLSATSSPTSIRSRPNSARVRPSFCSASPSAPRWPIPTAGSCPRAPT